MGTGQQTQGVPSGPKIGGLHVKALSLGDLIDALAAGARDLLAAPLTSLTIAAIYTLGGWFIAVCLFVLKLPYLIYPMAMGFALIAPFVAVAFYDVSHRLQNGVRPSPGDVWQSVKGSARRDVRWMALLTAFAFFIWMDIAAVLTLSFFGAEALDFGVLLKSIVTTSSGLTFLVVGHAVGAIIAFLVFSISVVSFPILYDRDLDVMSAIITSVRLVATSPLTMAAWCVIIAVSVVGAIVSGLILLPVVLPILGYATWHIYKRAVV
ncbi:MAG: DUF2189 domain-containing protein [Hyphomicrobiaceae bacterium]